MKRELLRRARANLAPRKGRARAADLRRSVSDAYYALFHALTSLCADQLIGKSKRNSEAWRRVYRGLDHANAKKEFQRLVEVRQMDARIKRVAATFVQLQNARHAADYDSSTALSKRADAEVLVLQAETAINDLESLDKDLAQSLAVILLIRQRG